MSFASSFFSSTNKTAAQATTPQQALDPVILVGKDIVALDCSKRITDDMPSLIRKCADNIPSVDFFLLHQMPFAEKEKKDSNPLVMTILSELNHATKEWEFIEQHSSPVCFLYKTTAYRLDPQNVALAKSLDSKYTSSTVFTNRDTGMTRFIFNIKPASSKNCMKHINSCMRRISIEAPELIEIDICGDRGDGRGVRYSQVFGRNIINHDKEKSCFTIDPSSGRLAVLGEIGSVIEQHQWKTSLITHEAISMKYDLDVMALQQRLAVLPGFLKDLKNDIMISFEGEGQHLYRVDIRATYPIPACENESFGQVGSVRIDADGFHYIIDLNTPFPSKSEPGLFANNLTEHEEGVIRSLNALAEYKELDDRTGVYQNKLLHYLEGEVYQKLIKQYHEHIEKNNNELAGYRDADLEQKEDLSQAKQRFDDSIGEKYFQLVKALKADKQNAALCRQYATLTELLGTFDLDRHEKLRHFQRIDLRNRINELTLKSHDAEKIVMHLQQARTLMIKEQDRILSLQRKIADLLAECQTYHQHLISSDKWYLSAGVLSNKKAAVNTLLQTLQQTELSEDERLAKFAQNFAETKHVFLQNRDAWGVDFVKAVVSLLFCWTVVVPYCLWTRKVQGEDTVRQIDTMLASPTMTAP